MIYREMQAVTVVVLACVAALLLYRAYLWEADVRWARPDNDRNTHFLTALQLGLDLRGAEGVQLAQDLLRIRTWPPLHPIVVGAWIACVGPRSPLAVFPNVVAWGMGLVLSFLLARRLTPCWPHFAGYLAMLFYWASPSHRAFGTDFMLEAGGSALTLLACYTYVGWRQGTIRNTCWVWLPLTLLFFEKYNYWLLVVLSMLLVAGWEHRAWLVDTWRTHTGRTHARWNWDGTAQAIHWLQSQLRLVSNIPWMIALTVLVGRVVGDAWQPLPPDAPRFGLRHANIIHIVWICLVLRLVVHWRSEGAHAWQAAPRWLQSLAVWHTLPLTIWFLLPKRLGYFLWYLSPANGPNTVGRSWIDSIRNLLMDASTWYHRNAWWASMSLLLVLALWLYRHHLRREIALLVVLVLVSLCLTLKHPNQKTRFLHSWIPAVWVLAGVGGSCLGGSLFRWLPGKGQAVIQTTALAGLACSIYPVALEAGASPESGHHQGASSLQLSREYLPWLDPTQSVVILSTLQIESFAEWTYVREYPQSQRPWTTRQMKWFGHDAAQNEIRFREWMLQHQPQQMVMIDIGRSSPFYFPDYDHWVQFRALVEGQPGYMLVRQAELPATDCTVYLYERRPVP